MEKIEEKIEDYNYVNKKRHTSLNYGLLEYEIGVVEKETTYRNSNR